MRTIEDIGAMRTAGWRERSRGRTVGLVPTMGYLHEGHLALVREARRVADWVVVSIFVNPIQFGPAEDLDRYPRDMERDLQLCRSEGVDCIFAPQAAAMYPAGFQTHVAVERLGSPLCGAYRPGHFQGVATVVLKLLHAVQPDIAVFGEKDYQQLQVIRRMARDLDLGVEIIGVPTVREPDGLAMSSRNAYLSPADRRRALSLCQALDVAQGLATAGERRAAAVAEAVRAVLDAAGVEVQYAELVDPETLERVDVLGLRTLLALAGWVGGTRLIDNRVLTVV